MNHLSLMNKSTDGMSFLCFISLVCLLYYCSLTPWIILFAESVYNLDKSFSEEHILLTISCVTFLLVVKNTTEIFSELWTLATLHQVFFCLSRTFMVYFKSTKMIFVSSQLLQVNTIYYFNIWTQISISWRKSTMWPAPTLFPYSFTFTSALDSFNIKILEVNYYRLLTLSNISWNSGSVCQKVKRLCGDTEGCFWTMGQYSLVIDSGVAHFFLLEINLTTDKMIKF